MHQLRSCRPGESRASSSRILPLLLTLLLGACGGGGSSSLEDFGLNEGSVGAGSGGQGPAETLRLGSGSGTNFSEGTLAASDTQLEAGESATIRANVVNQDGEAPSGSWAVTFNSPCVSDGKASFGEVAQPAPGLASVEYTASGCSGEDVITASLEGRSASASVTLTVTPPEVLSVSFVSATNPQISLAGIGGNESTELTFKVAGPQGVPIIGEAVSFSINTSVGGAAILSGRDTGITDNSGLVRTVLNSGTVAGPVNVLAVHNASGRQGLSDDIVISTGIPVANRFSLSWSPQNPPGAFDTDGVTVNFSIIASDQFGNNPTDGTRISFVSPESGNIQSSCELVDGTCSVTWRSSAPRPADMRVEVIAYTDGAERFTDNNGNSVYDANDGAIGDLGEPFTDENENNIYDLGEFFFDTNRNGVRDAGNGVWDGPCLSQVDASALCEGEDTVTIAATATIAMANNGARLFDLGDFPAPGTAISIVNGASATYGGLVVADSNSTADGDGGNPAPLGTGIRFSLNGGGASLVGNSSWTVPNATGPTGFYGVTIKTDPVTPPATPPSPTLLLSVTPPGEPPIEYTWPITILP